MKVAMKMLLIAKYYFPSIFLFYFKVLLFDIKFIIHIAKIKEFK